MGDLICDLGDPQTIDQLDNRNTLFCREEKGIIVFCHPLFRGQYERKERNDFIITSLFLACCQEIRQNIVPSADTILNFKHLLIEDIGTNNKNKDKFAFRKADYFLDYDLVVFMQKILSPPFQDHIH